MDLGMEARGQAKGHASEIIKGEAPEISLVVPCFNELDGIAATAERLIQYMESHFAEVRFELLIVDDGSTDGTRVLLRELAAEDPRLRTVFLSCNRGRGAAVAEGIRNSLGKFVITLDADLSYDVDHIGEIIAKFRENPKNDVIVVSPYMKGGVVKGVPGSRLLLSKTANWLLAGFFSAPLSTVTCVVRGYRGSMVRAVPLFEKGKEFHLEVLRKMALCGAGIQEIPGRLIWKESKKRAKRLNKKGLAMAAANHVLYAFLIKPTRLFKYATPILLALGLWETGTIVLSFMHYLSLEPAGWVDGMWPALSKAFAQSPHTFIIASVSLILALQSFSYLAILQVMRMQQEETMRHLVALLEGKKASFQER